MSENLKDILDSIKEAINKNDDSIDSFLIGTECWKELLDYITNLQKRLDFMIDRNNEKEAIIDQTREMLYKRDLDSYDTYTANVVVDIQSDFEEILKGEE